MKSGWIEFVPSIYDYSSLISGHLQVKLLRTCPHQSFIVLVVGAKCDRQFEAEAKDSSPSQPPILSGTWSHPDVVP